MSISRRQVTQALGFGAAAAWLGAVPRPVRALPAYPAVLSGTRFVLDVGPGRVNVTGRERPAILVNGGLPAPVLHWREGDTVTIEVRNHLDEPTSVHWHGLTVPVTMDGVPGFGFPGIPPGGSYRYRFTVSQSGTYWYHSHSGFQEQAGFYGAIVITPREADAQLADRDYVVVLSDWTDQDPRRVQVRLKKQADYYNFRQRTVGDVFRDAAAAGWRATLAERWAWRRMRMDPTDLADVTGATYTFLMNGCPPEENWTALFAPGERVRLRFINAAAMTYFDVRIPGLPMRVVAADGQPVEPVTVDEIRIANAETYDVIVEPAARAWTLFAQSMDRTGFARGTLAPAAGMAAAVPSLDPRPVLTLADIGHDHGAHGASAPPDGHTDPRAGHGHHQSGAAPAAGAATPTVRHAPAEYGPHVDMRVDAPLTRLDDPGIGLRDNGRRVLTYADLRSAFPDPDGRDPGRTLALHLTGHMGRYVWSFDGLRYSEAEALRFRHGERLRLVFVNDTMMEHPIHLHGMWSDLEDETGRFLVRKHTLTVRPGQRLSCRVSADALGRWALHCHLLYHMEGGMFREVRVEEDHDSQP